MIRMLVVFLRAFLFDAKMDSTVAFAKNPTTAIMRMKIWTFCAENEAVVADNVTFSNNTAVDWEVFEAMSLKCWKRHSQFLYPSTPSTGFIGRLC